jgi:hypothetical protein
MAKEQPFEVIESNYHKLEDIKNSCESLIQKIGQLQVDLFNYPNAKVEKVLGNWNGSFSNVHQDIVEVFTEYETEVYFPAKGIETFNSAEEEAAAAAAENENENENKS